MSSPTTAISRLEYSYGFNDFNLAASRLDFIGPSLFRPRLMGKQSSRFERLKTGQLIKPRVNIRRDKDATYKRDTHRFSTDDYATDEYGCEEPLSDRTVQMYSDIHDAESVAVERLVDTVLREYEFQCADLVQGGDYWPVEGESDLATDLSTAWSSHGSSTPIDDVENARETILNRTGIYPNALALSRKAFFHLKNSAQIIGRVVYNEVLTEETLTPALIGKVLGVKHIIISDAIQNAGDRDLDANLSQVWSNSYALLCRVSEGSDTAEPCIGRTFMWAEENKGGWTDRELACIIEEYRSEDVRAAVLRARADWQIKVLYPEVGQLLRGVVV